MNMQKINTQIYIYIHLSKKIKNWTTNFLIECQKQGFLNSGKCPTKQVQQRKLQKKNQATVSS